MLQSLQLEEMIEILEQSKTEVEQAYESKQTLTTPLPDIRRKMDTCTLVTSDVIILFTNPSAWAGYDTRSIFKRSLTGLNSEFSFS